MGYHKFIFETNDTELLTGVLSQFDFEAFSEEDDLLAAWITEDADRDQLAENIGEMASQFYTNFRIEHIPDQNWNAAWESTFDPVAVDDFCYVRARFHNASDAYMHEIVIDPKQAFGTGHHETTYMMLEAMRNMRFEGKRVLDLGCGTGILAILAAKMGAQDITAIDIETESVENAKENLALNGVDVNVMLGSTEVVEGQTFDIILANINRNAIMFLMEDIASLMSAGGSVVFSGFLEHNYDEVMEKADSLGLELMNRMQKGEWECLVLTIWNG
jgi:ribosomal protein L11 methyltransferase